MPIYEYECPLCGRFEVVQKVKDKALKANPDCTEAKCPRAAKKVMSSSAFHLKGSGWYSTDYKKATPAAPKSTKGGSGATPAAAAAETTTTETKETKTETKTDSAAAESSKPSKGSGGKCGSGCGCH